MPEVEHSVQTTAAALVSHAEARGVRFRDRALIQRLCQDSRCAAVVQVLAEVIAIEGVSHANQPRIEQPTPSHDAPQDADASNDPTAQ